MKKKVSDLIGLSVIFFGIQFLWTIEFAAGTPFLVSLGMSPATTGLVWLAGPLSGILVQPIIGSLSDSSSSKYGRRRPWLVFGGLMISVAMILIAYAQVIPSFFGLETTNQNLVISFAVFGFYLLDFSINVMMASARSLIVDVLESEHQQEGHATAGRMTNAGNVVGYFFGYLHLPKIFPFLGNTQLRVLCWLSLSILFSALVLTCVLIKEVPFQVTESQKAKYSVLKPLKDIIKSFRSIPPAIEDICNTQFYAWLGWFPFLFYSSSWIGEIQDKNKADIFIEASDSRIGSFGLFLFAVVSLLASIAVPPLTRMPISKIWALGLGSFSAILFLSLFTFNSLTLSLSLIALLGIPWFVCIWVPFALIGEVICRSESTVYQDLSNDVTEGLLDQNYDIEQLVDESDRNNSLGAGTILGIHNMYICIPQFVSALISMIVMYIAPGDKYGWTIRIGGVFAMIAGLRAWKFNAFK